MKFFTITVVSLGLGSQALAAPIDVASTVASVEGLSVSSVSSDALAAVESVPEVDTITSVLPNVVPFAKKDISIASIAGTVSSLHTTVSSQLVTISTLSASNISSVVVPAIKSHLTTIATTLNTTAFTYAPELAVPGTALSAAEAQALISTLTEVHGLVSEIQSTLSTTVSTVESDILTLVKPEITAVLSLVLPFVSPLVAFAYGVASFVPGGDAAIAEVTTAAGAVLGVAGTLLSPVEGVLGGLL